MPNPPYVATRTTAFVPVDLRTLRLDSRLPFDLYLKVHHQHVLYRHRALPFDGEAMCSLRGNGVERLYVALDSARDLADYYERHLASIVNDETVPPIQRARATVRVANALAADLLSNPDGAAVARSMQFAKNMAALVTTRPSSVARLLSLLGSGTTLEKHCVNTSMFAVAMADEAPDRTLAGVAKIAAAGLLHDIALGLVPPEVLRKPGALNGKERALVEEHPVTGALMLRQIGDLPSSVTLAVRWHHERLDGSGYPDGLRGAAIPWMARAVAIAEVFDALTSRPAISCRADSIRGHAAHAARHAGPARRSVDPRVHPQAAGQSKRGRALRLTLLVAGGHLQPDAPHQVKVVAIGLDFRRGIGADERAVRGDFTPLGRLQPKSLAPDGRLVLDFVGAEPGHAHGSKLCLGMAFHGWAVLVRGTASNRSGGRSQGRVPRLMRGAGRGARVRERTGGRRTNPAPSSTSIPRPYRAGA